MNDGSPTSAPRIADTVIGTGGLGTGILLAVEGDHTIGREESRAVRLLPQKDRCKLQNVLHYVARLGEADVVPIGRVGDDDAGRQVVSELAAEGMDVSRVRTDATLPTLASYCFTYPGGDGGNLTTSESASSAVGSDDIVDVEDLFSASGERAIAVATPEVPLAARVELLERAGRHGARRFASFLTAEVEAAVRERLLDHVDVVSINIDEAAAIAPRVSGGSAEQIAEAAIWHLAESFPRLSLVVTAGANGSWVYDGTGVHHQKAIHVDAVNTAGAGDAHLAGLVLASAWGASLVEANHFATVLSAKSVRSADTINESVTAATLLRFAAALQIDLPAVCRQALETTVTHVMAGA